MKAWLVKGDNGREYIVGNEPSARYEIVKSMGSELIELTCFTDDQLQAQKREVEQLHHRIKDLEAEREQIARACIIRGWEEACKWYVEVDKRDFHKELIEKQITFNDYWQQKRKEQDDTK